MKTAFSISISTLFVLIALGCSGENPAVSANVEPYVSGFNQTAVGSPGRTIWGIWQIDIDPDTLQASIIPARFAEFHANIRTFLEDSPCKNCLAIVPPIIPKPYGMDVTISITHPFPNNEIYVGFDVRGIVMLNGEYVFPKLNYLTTRAKTGGWALLNPDGFTNIFNAVEYTKPGILGYSRGKMVPPSWPPPTNTLNAFKAFYSPNQSENEGGRRAFFPGDTVKATYQLQVVSGQPLRYWYAVDASWEHPTGTPPYQLDDFPINANCPEAYRFDFSVVSGELFPTGGSIIIGVDVWDHQGWPGGPETITLEAPECMNDSITTVQPPMYISGQKAHWEFQINNQKSGLNPSIGAELLVIVKNPNDDPLTGPIHGFGRYTMPVSTGPSQVKVTEIDPNSGIQGKGIDNAKIKGSGFQPGCTVRLEKSGQANIPGTDVTFIDSGNLSADFSLVGAAVGLWNVVVENPGGAFGVLLQGFEVLQPSGCNNTIHDKYLGKGDYGGGTFMTALDSTFVHHTGQPCDGEILGYISGVAGTAVITFNVDTLNPELGHGLGGGGWGNPHIGSWPTPLSIDISEEAGRFFIVWSDNISIVEVWNYYGKLAGETDASNGGRVFCLDTDGHNGFWNCYFPKFGFACGVKHFIPDGPLPGTLVEKTADSFLLPEAWGTPAEMVVIPDKLMLILTGLDKGKIRVYDISKSPPTLINEKSGFFSDELDFGSYTNNRPCDMEAEWSDPDYAHCRIILWGNLKSGGGELLRIDENLNILAGPIKIPGTYESMAINPKTLNVTLWPERDGSAGAYALVEVPPGW